MLINSENRGSTHLLSWGHFAVFVGALMGMCLCEFANIHYSPAGCVHVELSPEGIMGAPHLMALECFWGPLQHPMTISVRDHTWGPLYHPRALMDRPRCCPLLLISHVVRWKCSIWFIEAWSFRKDTWGEEEKDRWRDKLEHGERFEAIWHQGHVENELGPGDVMNQSQ